MDNCPCCKRDLEKITDFPEIKVVRVNILQEKDVPPEIMLNQRIRKDCNDVKIANYSPLIKELLNENDSIKTLLENLKKINGKTIFSKSIFPEWLKADVFGYMLGEVPETEELKIFTKNTLKEEQIRGFEFNLCGYKAVPLYQYGEIIKMADIQYVGILY